MNTHTNRSQRKSRTRTKLRAVSSVPRLSIFRSNQHIWAQVVDDSKNITIASSSDKTLKLESGTKLEKAAKVGQNIAEIALAKKVKKVVFDRGSYKYHGRIKALADAARKKGLEF